MRVARQAVAPLAVAVALLGGCVTDGGSAPRPPRHENRQWFSDWDRLVRETAAQAKTTGAPALERLAKDGDQVAIHHLALRPGARLAAPPPAAEVVIVVEGAGTISVGERARPVEAGAVLVLPAGARGRALARADRPLLALAVRSKAPAPPDATPRPAILAIDDLFPDAAIHGPAKVWRQRIARLPGQLAVDAVAVKLGEIPRHVHYAHDEVVFVLEGFGTLGHGEDGPPVETDAGEETLEISRGFVSSAIRTKSLLYLPTRTAHSFLDEANPTLALSISAPELGDDPDTYAVPDNAQAQQGEVPRYREERRPGVESAIPAPTPTRRIRFEPGEGEGE